MRTSMNSQNPRLRRPVAIAAAALASTLVLASCSEAEDAADDASSAASSAVSSATESDSGNDSDKDSEDKSDDPIVVEDAYIGAKGTDSQATAVYMTLANKSDEDIIIDEVEGSLDADYELHEVVDGVMREKDGGFTIPAGQSVTLEPGGDHIMIMDYSKEIAAGDTVTLTLEDSKGGKHELKDVPVRVQQSRHEHYADDDATDGDTADGDHDGHEDGHGDHEEHKGH